MGRFWTSYFASTFFLSTVLAHPTSLDEGVRNSCGAQCDHIPTWAQFEECLRLCYSQTLSLPSETTPAMTRKYPERPSNMVVVWNVQIERYVKYVRATVYWETDDNDSLREGFYLSFLPTDERCEAMFPGYYTRNIPKDAVSWEIPAALPGLQPLIIDYGCEYRVELRSKPYPYGDPKYTLVETFEVPTCVEGYCSCKKQRKLPSPTDLELEFFPNHESSLDKVSLNWRYNISLEYFKEGTKNIQFRVLLADLFRKPTVAPWKKLFKWRPWNYTVLASQEQLDYSAELPDLKEGFEYKVQIFAMNEHICKSEPVEKEFIFTSPSTTSASTASTNTTVATGEKTIPTVTAVSNENWPLNDTNLNATEFGKTADADGDRLPAVDSSPSTAPGTVDSSSPTMSMETVNPSYSRDEYFLMVFLPIITILCLIITAFAICKFYAARKQKLLKKQQYFERLIHFPWTVLTHASTSPSMETNILYTEKEIIDARARGLADEYEISYERLAMGRVIGQGAFGLVYLGTALAINNTPGLTQVAIKQLKANADERERFEFLEEIAIMKKVGHHPNIVSMYGCCTLQYPHCMVMEYVPYGDLLRYLRHLRKEFEKQIEEYRISLERDYIMQLNTHPLMTHAEINAAVRSAIASSGHTASGYPQSRSDGMEESGDESLVYEEGSDYPIPFADADQDIDMTQIVQLPRAQHDSSQQLTYSLDPAELQSFAYQVACGMGIYAFLPGCVHSQRICTLGTPGILNAKVITVSPTPQNGLIFATSSRPLFQNHLEQLNITHRDLAARNILVGHGKTLKISDFGLSRMGVYVKTTSGRIPLRWLSIEAMRDHTYSTKSDVWAYGTVLWEISTLGGFPYPTIADKDILRYLESGNRLEKPVSCSDAFYRLMLQCWSHSPLHRPSFAHIKQTLNEMNKQASPYVEFSPGVVAVDRLSVLPPQEYCRISPLAGIQSSAPTPSPQGPMSPLAVDNESYIAH